MLPIASLHPERSKEIVIRGWILRQRELLTFIFEQLNQNYADLLKRYREKLLPSMLNVPIWEIAYRRKLQ